jgi:hypothetical protein
MKRSNLYILTTELAMRFLKVTINNTRDNKTLLYWGYVYDIRSFIRTAVSYAGFPRSLSFLKVSNPNV